MSDPGDARLSAMIDQAHAQLRDHVEVILCRVHDRCATHDHTDVTLDLGMLIERAPYTREALSCMLAIALVEVEKARCPQ